MATNPWGNISFGGQTQQTPALPATYQGGGSTFQNATNWFGSPGGQAITGAVGGALQAYQQHQDQQASQNQSAAQMLQNQFNQNRADQASRAAGVLQADPLGSTQKYGQHNALLSAILPNLRNAHSTPGDPRVAAAMGSRSGGIVNALPSAGLDPEMINSMFGPQATMAAITQRQKELTNLDPTAPQMDLTTMYGADAAPFMDQITSWAAEAQQKTGAERAAFEQELKQRIDQQAQEEEGDGFWHKFARYAGIAGAVAATIATAGGASPLLVAAIGAGAGAAQGWGSGGGATGALLGAGLGAAGGFAGGAGSAGQAARAAGVGATASQQLRNPALYGAIIGASR